MPKERKDLTAEELFVVNKIGQIIRDTISVTAYDSILGLGTEMCMDSVSDAALLIYNDLWVKK